MDNKLRKLTDAQNEFFKDSKVKDESGNLITVYHGTKKEFDEFKIKMENGFYFTDNKEVAKTYTKDTNNFTDKISNEEGIIYECYLNLKNPLVIDCKNRSWNNIADRNPELRNNFPKEGLKWLDYHLEGGKRLTTKDIEDYVINSNYLSKQDSNYQFYDGCIFKNVRDGNCRNTGNIISTTYSVLSPDAIKSIDNLYPTNSNKFKENKLDNVLKSAYEKAGFIQKKQSALNKDLEK
jgi:hypothetical protein